MCSREWCLIFAEFRAHRKAYFTTRSRVWEGYRSIMITMFTGIYMNRPSGNTAHLAYFEVGVFRHFLRLFARSDDEVKESLEQDAFLIEARLLCLSCNLRRVKRFPKLGRSFPRDIPMAVLPRVAEDDTSSWQRQIVHAGSRGAV
jgi:hypothetical protein